MFKELKVMKTNILNTMKQFAKYFCAVLLVLGTSASAWSAGIYLEYDGVIYYSGSTITINLDYTGSDLSGHNSFTLGNNAGWTASSYNYGYIHAKITSDSFIEFYTDESTLSSSNTTCCAPYYDDYLNPSEITSYNNAQYLQIFFDDAYYIDGTGDYTATIAVTQKDYNDASTLQSGTFTITYHVTSSCLAPTILIDPDEKEGDYRTLTSFGIDVLSNSEGTISWTSTNTDVATVSGDGEGATVIIVGAGMADIKCSQAADDTNGYCEGEETCTLLVNAVAPAVSSSVTGKELTVTNITNTGATFSGGVVTDRGGEAELQSYGFIVGSSADVTYATKITQAGTNSDYALNTAFGSKSVTGLTANTTYYVRPIANNTTGIGYGAAVSFTTPYAVSFDDNGADSGDVPATRYVANGSTTTLPEQGTLSKAGCVFEGWAEGSPSGTVRAAGYTHTVSANITFYAKWHEIAYTDAKFSCADWTLTGPIGDIVFITSAASKTVRSQESFHVSGNGLPHNTALTFSIFPLSSKFVIKKADGTIPQTNEYGVVDADVYVFYTPDAGDTSDGLDEFTSLTVSVEGEPRTATIDTKTVIGRHLPADFVIAVKRNNKWLALPATMNELTNPTPVEIAVDNIDNPSAAYTAASNIYNLYGQNSGSGGKLYTNGETVKLGMKNNSNKPLFGSATGTSTVKGDGTATVTNNIGSQYWWTLSQTATSITNPQDAQYSVTCSNNTAPFVLKENAGNPQWGFFTTGSVGAIRLIPATDIPFTEAEVVEWGRNGAILEVNAQGIDATSVVAHLGEATSAAITLTDTKTSVKGTGTKYNYTVNFGEGIDFAAAASNGAMLTLEWKNGGSTKAMSNIVVPKIIAANTTMSALMATDDPWNKADVHVLPGVTLTANAGDFSSKDVVVDRLEIYPGATVKVTKGAQDAGTLKVRTLVLRNGWTRVGSKNYDVARLYVSTDAASLAKNAVDNVWYSDWYIDYDQYYPIAVPWNVATAGISYKNTKSTATAGVKIRYYDGARRAEYGQQEQDENWVAYTWGGTMPANLEPSKGYAMTAKRPTGKAFSIVRMPMTIPSNSWTASGEHGYIGETHKDQVSVTGYGKGTAEWYAMGWNFIGNPYMCTFNGNDDGISGKLVDQQGKGVRYATIPDLEFKNYDQVPIAEANLKPASAFFIQAEDKDPQTITFSDGNILPPSAPARYTTNDETVPEQEAYIRLSHEGGRDQMGLIIGEDYTEAYEPNADLAKMLGEANAVKTYMRYGEMDMAYVAINQTLAKQWIPITVKIPADGEYTYSLTRSSTVDALEGIYLIDYGNGDKITNLLEDTYQFEAEAGTISGRFAINAIFGERPVPTDIDIVGGDINGSEPIKFLYHDKVFILHNGVIYDATGKKVREINK